MEKAYDGRQVVGMDLHRRRSVLVRMTMDGRKLETARIGNGPAALRAVIARAGKNPRVVVEATYGWYWAADVLEAAGAEVHLAHPLGVKAFSYRRVKNDERFSASPRGPGRARSRTRSPRAAATTRGTSPRPRPPASCSPRCSTPCATGTSAAAPARQRELPALLRDARIGGCLSQPAGRTGYASS